MDMNEFYGMKPNEMGDFYGKSPSEMCELDSVCVCDTDDDV